MLRPQQYLFIYLFKSKQNADKKEHCHPESANYHNVLHRVHVCCCQELSTLS